MSAVSRDLLDSANKPRRVGLIGYLSTDLIQFTMEMTVLKRFIVLISLVCLLGFSLNSLAQERNIAITIDDLPFVGEEQNFHLNMIIDAFKSQGVPTTGFVIAGKVRPENWPMLQKFKDAGLGIGNHTLSHANAHQMSTDAYIHQIDEADKRLSPLLTKPKYFRYPYLAMGEGQKKEAIQNFLSSRKYHIAPITIDSQDFIFNQLLLTVPERERRQFLAVLKPCYINFIWQQTLKAEEAARSNHKEQRPQILLIHANLLNAYVLPDIIDLYKAHGFNFVSLKDALKPAHSSIASRWL